jgi:hypothetical protein
MDRAINQNARPGQRQGTHIIGRNSTHGTVGSCSNLQALQGGLIIELETNYLKQLKVKTQIKRKLNVKLLLALHSSYT